MNPRNQVKRMLQIALAVLALVPTLALAQAQALKRPGVWVTSIRSTIRWLWALCARPKYWQRPRADD